MKIPLNMNQDGGLSSNAMKARQLEAVVLAAKQGDWNAKTRLAQKFMPLLTSLAQRRTSDPAKTNDLIENGKKGLYKAAVKYKKSVGADKFQIFALKFIEAAMDGKGGGFLSKIFGG